jgi:hypothetical protein
MLQCPVVALFGYRAIAIVRLRWTPEMSVEIECASFRSMFPVFAGGGPEYALSS